MELWTQWILIFFVYACMGWVAEVLFHYVTRHEWVNRGFLSGPLCPIYGFGMVAVLILLDPLKKQPLFLFVGAVVVCSALEYVTGWVLDHLFHQRWWDYSAMPFNLGGYITLSFSLLWGVAGAFLVYALQPLVLRLLTVLRAPEWLAILLSSIFIVDLIATIRRLVDFNKLQAQLDRRLNALESQARERVLSNRLLVDEVEVRLRRDLDQMFARYRRTLKAFPKFHIVRPSQVVEYLHDRSVNHHQ